MPGARARPSVYVVLLRGVNVGTAKRVPMTRFKAVLTGLGCRDVTTLLNSGNAVVSAGRTSPAKLAPRIAGALRDSFGFDVPVVVKSSREFSDIVAGNPLAAGAVDHSRLLVTFVQETATLKMLEPISVTAVAPERFVIGAHGAYLYCPGGILQSGVAGALVGKAGAVMTTRNWATVLKLQALAAAGQAA